MIPLTVPQKNVVMSIFKDDIQTVKKYFNAISFDFDDSFEYAAFKDFIYSAAGMFKEIDMGIYNKELVGKFKTIQHLDGCYSDFLRRSKHVAKLYQNDFLHEQTVYMAEKKRYEGMLALLQTLITKEKSFYQLRLQIEATLADPASKLSKQQREDLEKKLKNVKKNHVDAVHQLGESKKEIEELSKLLNAFEEQHKEEFMEFFRNVKEKLEHQYSQSLSFFGYEFNEALFVNSEKSELIKKFKKEANISGEMSICKYVEYYLRNVNPDALADAKKRALLNKAKQYCRNQKERENLF